MAKSLNNLVHMYDQLLCVFDLIAWFYLFILSRETNHEDARGKDRRQRSSRICAKAKGDREINGGRVICFPSVVYSIANYVLLYLLYYVCYLKRNFSMCIFICCPKYIQVSYMKTCLKISILSLFSTLCAVIVYVFGSSKELVRII